MNLYAVKFRHYSPKDSKDGILTYLLANSDEDVYNWIRSEPESIYVSWMCYDDPKNSEYEEGFKERIISCHGDMYDNESDVFDTYYGATQYGWDMVKDNVLYTDVIQAKNSLGIQIVDTTVNKG